MIDKGVSIIGTHATREYLLKGSLFCRSFPGNANDFVSITYEFPCLLVYPRFDVISPRSLREKKKNESMWDKEVGSVFNILISSLTLLINY